MSCKITVAVTGLLWLANLRQEPCTGQYRFKYPWIGIEDWLKEQKHYITWPTAISAILESYQVANPPKYSQVLWPVDHPSHMRYRKVFDRLLEANGMKPDEWELCFDRNPSKTNGFC